MALLISLIVYRLIINVQNSWLYICIVFLVQPWVQSSKGWWLVDVKKQLSLSFSLDGSNVGICNNCPRCFNVTPKLNKNSNLKSAPGRSANSLETLIFNDRNNVGASHRSSLKLGNNKLATKSLSFSQPPFQKFIAISCKISQNGEN